MVGKGGGGESRMLANFVVNHGGNGSAKNPFPFTICIFLNSEVYNYEKTETKSIFPSVRFACMFLKSPMSVKLNDVLQKRKPKTNLDSCS